MTKKKKIKTCDLLILIRVSKALIEPLQFSVK